MAASKVLNQAIGLGTYNASTPTFNLLVAPFYGAVPTISADFTVTTDYNELTPGPVTVANGVTVTVANNANWTVV